MPPIPPEDFVQAVKALVDVDRDWVPHSDGASLYIRPFCIATDVAWAFMPPSITALPSSARPPVPTTPRASTPSASMLRMSTSVPPRPDRLYEVRRQLRRVHQAGELAEERGFSQVLWLDGVEKKYVEEVGSMNIMFKIDGEIYTAPCVGIVLRVTRRSIIELLKDWGYKVHEERVAIADIMKAADEGKLEEVFGTGTAAVVSPVKELDGRARLPHQRRPHRRADPEAV